MYKQRCMNLRYYNIDAKQLRTYMLVVRHVMLLQNRSFNGPMIIVSQTSAGRQGAVHKSRERDSIERRPSRSNGIVLSSDPGCRSNAATKRTDIPCNPNEH